MTPILLLAAACAAVASTAASAQAPQRPSCQARSPSTLTPVIELYTSEGCSSCPPADRWISTLKDAAAHGGAVVQAFHVGYWDYIGWVDRFASPAHTVRQRQVAAWNRQSGIYTPQVVRNGEDWRAWEDKGAAERALASRPTARASIEMRRSGDDAIQAVVTTPQESANWAAYWTVTEHGHASKVRAGENAGEFLRHDFVVRQYVPAGTYKGLATLTLRTIAVEPGHPRQVNLVVFDPRTGMPLQALSLGC